ncbi:MAG: ABC transporter substrate-binding protein [Deltaproteobacteria bacterium]|nr:ABC transporter substrate-binding protein [Deltaproteobacteria bacterium]
MPQTIRVAHSPDSDDAFMFYGLFSGAVKADGLEFVQEFGDIESLNRRAQDLAHDITAISVHAYAYLHENYVLLDAGASFGDGYGPTVIVNQTSRVLRLEELGRARIAVPGQWTSAVLALRMRLPGFDPMFVDFKDVGRVVKLGKAEGGLVIHEGQLTAREDGFRVIEDLGASWKERTGLPLPLGMNALRRDLPEPMRRTLARVMAETVAYGLDHREQALDYAMGFARGLDRKKADQFVGMYVNDWTRDVGPRGREAVRLFLSEAADLGLVPRVTPEFQER